MKYVSVDEIIEALKDYPPMLTIDEASELMRCSTQVTRRLVRDGEIKVAKAGRRYLITKQSMVEYMAQED